MATDTLDHPPGTLTNRTLLKLNSLIHFSLSLSLSLFLPPNSPPTELKDRNLVDQQDAEWWFRPDFGALAELASRASSAEFGRNLARIFRATKFAVLTRPNRWHPAVRPGMQFANK